MATQAQVDQELADAVAETAEITTVVDAAIVALNAFPAQMQKALDDYKAANPTVTDAQLADLQTTINAQKAKVAELAAAIPANTPAAG